MLFYKNYLLCHACLTDAKKKEDTTCSAHRSASSLRRASQLYLSDEEFQSALGCTKSEWEGMTAWKKEIMKKEACLW